METSFILRYSLDGADSCSPGKAYVDADNADDEDFCFSGGDFEFLARTDLGFSFDGIGSCP